MASFTVCIYLPLYMHMHLRHLYGTFVVKAAPTSFMLIKLTMTCESYSFYEVYMNPVIVLAGCRNKADVIFSGSSSLILKQY